MTLTLEAPPRLLPVIELTEDVFEKAWRLFPDFRIEQTAQGDVIIMAPAGGETGSRNSIITVFLGSWALKDDTGIAFDSSTGFTLPNGAKRSPDAAWVLKSRLTGLTPEQKRKYLPLCPDFVVELASPSDSLPTLQAKMQEYRDNGARLGWLLNPETRQVIIYRPDAPPETLQSPASVSGEPLMSGFILDLTRVWDAGF